METLVATVLIVVVFMGASMVLNNLFTTSIQLNDNWVRQELLRLQYQYQNGQLLLPYRTKLGSWDIEVSTQTCGVVISCSQIAGFLDMALTVLQPEYEVCNKHGTGGTLIRSPKIRG